MAEQPSTKRRYRSGYRYACAAETKAALVASMLALIGKGNFRPRFREIADGAGYVPSMITYHFGSVEMLCRYISRFHTAEAVKAIRQALPAEVTLTTNDDKALAWLVLVGKPRD